MVQPQGFLCPTTMCSEDAPLTWLLHWVGAAIPVLSRMASPTTLCAPSDAKTLQNATQLGTMPRAGHKD